MVSVTSTNSLSGPNDSKSVVDPSLGKPSIISIEGSNTPAFSVSTSTSQFGASEAAVQPELLSTASPVAQPTVESLHRPNTRSQLRAISAFTEDYKSLAASEEDIPTITPKSATSTLSDEFSKQWKESMLREVKSRFENNVFEAAIKIPLDTQRLCHLC